jgi:DNA-binding MarR family transcriptional regulator
MEAALETVQLSSPKFVVLSILVEAGEPLTLSDLASRASCVRSNMTQMIDRLEADGLVRRVYDPLDRRSVRAELTTLGRQRQAAGAEQMHQVRDQFASRLPDVDLSTFSRALAALE